MSALASWRRVCFGSGLAFALACSKARHQPLVKEAEFGVFFGGQVQELKEIPKQLEPGRQRHGFRLTFREPLAQDLLVSWEISFPEPAKGGPRAANVGEVTAKAGVPSLDVPLSFRPSDPVGIWHAKVTAGGESVIDRDFTVLEAASSARSKSSAR